MSRGHWISRCGTKWPILCWCYGHSISSPSLHFTNIYHPVRMYIYGSRASRKTLPHCTVGAKPKPAGAIAPLLQRRTAIGHCATDVIHNQCSLLSYRVTVSAVLWCWPVVGCVDEMRVVNGWARRLNTDHLVIRCNWTRQEYHLKCVDNTWTGDVVNCSQRRTNTQFFHRLSYILSRFVILLMQQDLQNIFKQEAQLMLTNPHDAYRGQSRSPNIVPFHMLGTFRLVQ